MRRAPPRLNRLPQRLDYTLIPAPLDLNRPLVDEKAELPAIIVTPSSPVFESEFFIAFLAPPPSPTFAQRVSSVVPAFRSFLPSQIQLPASPFKASFDERNTAFSLKGHIRTVILLLVMFFIMASHVVLHRVATNHPHLDFGMTPDHDIELSSILRADKDVFGARGGKGRHAEGHSSDDWNRFSHRVPSARFAKPVDGEDTTPLQGNDNDTTETLAEAAA